MGQGEKVANLTLDQIRHLIKAEGWTSVAELLWRAELGALLLWALVSVPLVAALYFGLRPLFGKIVRKHEAAETEELAPSVPMK